MATNENVEVANEFYRESHCCNCGSTRLYVTSFCNFQHCGDCGWATNDEHAEDCEVNPCMIAFERNGDFERADHIAQHGCSHGDMYDGHDPRVHDTKDWEE